MALAELLKLLRDGQLKNLNLRSCSLQPDSLFEVPSDYEAFQAPSAEGMDLSGLLDTLPQGEENE